MTGTGTQADPYMPENWDEIVETVGKTDKYVKCVPNLVIDWNDVDPTGKMYDIDWTCGEFNGNGLIISGIFINFDNYSSPLFDNSNGGIVKNTRFLNFDINSGHLFSGSNRYTTRWQNLYFDGTISERNSKLFSNNISYIEYSYIGLKLYGGASVSSSDVKLYHSVLNIENDKNSHSNNYLNLMGSDYIFKGSYGNKVGVSYTYRAILDFELTHGGSSDFTAGTNANKQNMIIYNNDKIPIENPGIIPATTAQLKDPEALKALGFPIRSV